MKPASIIRMDFKFSNLMHSALVSITGDNEKTYVHIQLINSFLRKVAGIEHIRFYDYNGEIRLDDANHPFVYQIAQLVNARLIEEVKGNWSPLRVV